MSRSKGWLIVPGSVGPVVLGDLSTDVRFALGEPVSVTKAGTFENYLYGDISVTFQSGRVSMVVSELESEAATSSGIVTGCGLSELIAAVGEIAYEEEEGLWQAEGDVTIFYELVRWQRSGEEAINPPYVPELFEISEPDDAIVLRIFVQ